MQMPATFSSLALADQGTITASLASAPASWNETLLAAILSALPASPTHKQVTDAIVMALAPVGISVPEGLGLTVLTGSDVLPLIAGGGVLSVAATAV
jgi:hypothetical protein